MAVKNAKSVLKKIFAFVSIAVEMQAMLHIVSFLNDIEFIKVLKPLQNKKGQKNLRYPTKKQSSF